ncbi:MFS transporter [Pusillimonas sp. SM2304]|uniref:MFS transporter n=1 Tax=Pusillimonas sp. SM2304 TaxID=3073241 RepID=UPI0028759C00|nr:MFS transporter [Pusillimonas sp. SM2304]MDS1139107.1 MFS transporter [Pusillimonas sp. SM2304]
MRGLNANRWLILAIISSALFLIVIDMTVLYTALPTLTHDLRASASEKLWIINAYGLVVAGLLLGMGTLGDRLGHKRLFVAGLAVFGIASLCAAFSPTPVFLIAARALLAVGAAMMMPATLSILRLIFTDESERAMAIGLWAAVASGGAAFGPVLGGVLLEHFWWGSVFLINVPVVLVALVLAIWLIPGRPGNAHQKWDLVGSLQVMVGLIGLAYAIKELGKLAPSYQAALVACAVGCLFIGIFVRRQRRSAQPLLDFTIFLHPGFGVAVLSALVAAIALMGMELVFTQRLQLVLDMSPLEAGLFILPLPLASFVSGPVAGRWLPRVGSRSMLAGSLLVSGAGMAACMALYNASAPLQMTALFVLGAGLGAAMTAASSTIMNNAPAERAGMAASVEEVSYELGGAIGVTLMGSILSAVYSAAMALPAGLAAPAMARDSLDEALLAAENLPVEAASILIAAAKAAFDQGFVIVMGSCALLLAVTAAVVWFRYGRR